MTAEIELQSLNRPTDSRVHTQINGMDRTTLSNNQMQDAGNCMQPFFSCFNNLKIYCLACFCPCSIIDQETERSEETSDSGSDYEGVLTDSLELARKRLK